MGRACCEPLASTHPDTQGIADKIGVSDPEVVYRYLQSAVHKIAGLDGGEATEANGKHAGAHIDEVAQRSGLASGLVRWEDLQPPPDRSTRRRR